MTVEEALRVVIAPGTERSTNGTGGRMDIASGLPALPANPGPARLINVAPPRARLETATSRHAVLLLPMPDPRRATAGIQRLEVVVDGWRFEVDVEPEARAALRDRATRARDDAAHRGPLELRAIIPGRVLSVDVAEGDHVEAGQRVLVLEAMKMQNELRSPRAGTVAGLAVGPGRTVELGDRLMVIE